MINLIVADESHTLAVAHLVGALFEEVEHSPDEEQIAEIFAAIDADGARAWPQCGKDRELNVRMSPTAVAAQRALAQLRTYFHRLGSRCTLPRSLLNVRPPSWMVACSCMLRSAIEASAWA